MLKVLIVTQDDPFYTTNFFKELIKIHSDPEIKIEGTIIQEPLGKNRKELIKKMFGFFGLFYFLIYGIKYIIYKFLDYIACQIFNGKFPGYFSIRHILLKNDWKILNLTNINSEETINLIKSSNIDLIVSVAASQIFKKEIIHTPKYGCINIHNAKLPLNRGMLPNFWALYNYDKEPYSAITVHKINEKLDDGEIILQKQFKLDPEKPLLKLIKESKIENARLLYQALTIYKSGEPELIPNNSAEATYNTFPTSDDVKKFKKKGLKIL